MKIFNAVIVYKGIVDQAKPFLSNTAALRHIARHFKMESRKIKDILTEIDRLNESGKWTVQVMEDTIEDHARKRPKSPQDTAGKGKNKPQRRPRTNDRETRHAKD